ncbi:MAG: AAA family ATPase [Dysgonamonadaceae bacterium]|jgi:hypothetical protein|nr:AAA family ATPase [Dysgonamonadaceae bacterium]
MDHFETLIKCHLGTGSVIDKYNRMRLLLEVITQELTSGDNIAFPNLFARLYYVCEKKELSQKHTRWINAFRVRSNNIIYSGYSPGEDEYLFDLRAMCCAISKFYNSPVPAVLHNAYKDLSSEEKGYGKEKFNRRDRVRIMVISWNNTFIYGLEESNPNTEELIRISYNKKGSNEEFNSSMAMLWKYCRLNLIDVSIEEETYIPQIIIIEPDYLVDISSLAECMKEYGKNPLYYLRHKFEPSKNTKHVLLGNTANYFLDAIVNKKEGEDSEVNFQEVIKKAFKTSPLDYATCPDIDGDFFVNARRQFDNIRNVVDSLFIREKINRNEAVLEPSFICEHLGLQGRMDFLIINEADSVLIELKSGKAPYPETNYSLVGLNHQTKAFLYQIVLQKVLNIDFKKLRTYLLYSKYSDEKANLRFVRPYMSAIKEALNIRNMIVAIERDIISDKTNKRSAYYTGLLIPEVLISEGGKNINFIERYIVPQIKEFQFPFNDADDLELSYFHALHTFVSREHYLAKTGFYENETNRGFSSLWQSSLENKKEEGEILAGLEISEIHTGNDRTIVTMRFPQVDREEDFVSNFRNGDIILFYERNKDSDNVTNKQIFRGAIERISLPDSITIRLRSQQKNTNVFPSESKYAIEHDFLESSYISIYRGLYSFLQANRDRRDLLLGRRLPRYDSGISLSRNYMGGAIDNIILKAKQAEDYFILVGPPGTGKTSCMLKSMVEEFYSEEGINILLLAYTNRAVDEICDALDSINPAPPYIRIGQELSCKEEHRNKLLDRIIESCQDRRQVLSMIQKYRIFVSTTTSMSSRTELFKLKHFHVAIIDEASQILEPQITGILSARDAEGNNAVEKFIMIGDHKQLPAIVLQSKEDSTIKNKELNEAGMTDLRLSLFERLYRKNVDSNNDFMTDMLYRQGRMHPDISLFPNTAFYQNRLIPVPLKHQEETLEFIEYNADDPIEKMVATRRVAFIPSEKAEHNKSNKNNISEARIAASISKSIHHLYTCNHLLFEADKTVGIITPYRSQIALIKEEIYKLEIPALNEITVDTVERYQGSQRDIIIYSFSVNDCYQLEFISNTMEENGMIIDRKLNVALTRAKKQMFITGNPEILSQNPVFDSLIKFLNTRK